MPSNPGHKALRKGRRSRSGQIYLLTTVTANRQRLFEDWELANLACRCTIHPDAWGDAQPLGWVLMPDHWHGMIELGARDDLARIMARFKAITTRAIHRILPDLTVWARGYHDHAIRKEESLSTAMEYVLDNPLRAKLVSHRHDYPYWNTCWL